MNAPGLPDDDATRFALVAARLHTAVIGDVLDRHGLVHQFLPAHIRPIAPEMRLVGRAMPVRIEPVEGVQSVPFGRLTEALDALRPHEVYVAHNGDVPCAAWGEILTAAARQRGAVGAVVDGYHRDTSRVLTQGFPVFSAGCYAQDAAVRSSVVDVRVEVTIGDVRIRPGDLVVGDRDGVVVVPAASEDRILLEAMEKADLENLVLKAIEEGMSATDAFARYGVL